MISKKRKLLGTISIRKSLFEEDLQNELPDSAENRKKTFYYVLDFSNLLIWCHYVTKITTIDFSAGFWGEISKIATNVAHFA